MAIGGLISNRNFGSLIGSGGWIADTLVSRGLSITAVRKGSDAFSQSGLYSNHQDIGPRYAGVLLGLSNTAGVLAGVFGTAATGYILQRGVLEEYSFRSSWLLVKI
ncbi:hypothetical protein POPTR_002G160650v4 [Populus trichocarpa]|uniref:Uncharacterized protein n=1 Tax=Populus trichocarpa TaxID=3694 RepID=A0ACC0TER2_POPTR|nr:hypothetical protein BDE02_02G148800 [Populus trichocarpa]KAI9399885.1 hypothetical protein POPTR_002G160650v4 [Populus trichocarpa]